MESGKAYWRNDRWIIIPDNEQNLERVETLNGGKTDGVPIVFELADPRKARPKQRALFFSLLGDIHNWSGEPTEWLKDYFYTRYTIKTAGAEISLADDTKNTVSDATELIEDVVDFIFEFGVPIHEGYTLLPRNENYFQYECIKHRQCLVCGQHADIDHIDEIGAGRNRTHLNHTQFRLAALCRVHHTERHKIGTRRFCQLHHLTNIGIKVDAQTLKRIGVQGRYGSDKT